MNDFFRKIKLVNREDFIWLIYFFVIVFAFISNKYERNYLINKDLSSKYTYQKINSTILIIAFFIYLYFTITSYNNLETLKKNANKKDVRVAYETLISNILFLIAGAIAIYADADSNSVDIGIF